jgi:hypothetical protein
MNKPQEMFNLPATLRPGEFPLGSMESRAASRALLERMDQSTEKIRVVVECIGTPEKNFEFEVPYLNARGVR